MLDQIAKHGLIDLEIKAIGDLEVDEHHTIEDTALLLGKLFRKLLDKKRYRTIWLFTLPMDDALARLPLISEEDHGLYGM